MEFFHSPSFLWPALPALLCCLSFCSISFLMVFTQLLVLSEILTLQVIICRLHRITHLNTTFQLVHRKTSFETICFDFSPWIKFNFFITLVCVYMCVYVHECNNVCIYMSMRMCMHICVCMSVYVHCVRMCVCV